MGNQICRRDFQKQSHKLDAANQKIDQLTGTVNQLSSTVGELSSKLDYFTKGAQSAAYNNGWNVSGCSHGQPSYNQSSMGCQTNSNWWNGVPGLQGANYSSPHNYRPMPYQANYNHDSRQRMNFVPPYNNYYSEDSRNNTAWSISLTLGV